MGPRQGNPQSCASSEEGGAGSACWFRVPGALSEEGPPGQMSGIGLNGIGLTAEGDRLLFTCGPTQVKILVKTSMNRLMECKWKTSSLRCMKYSNDLLHCVTSVRLPTRDPRPELPDKAASFTRGTYYPRLGKTLPGPTYAQGPRVKKASAGWKLFSDAPTFLVKVCYKLLGGTRKNPQLFHM